MSGITQTFADGKYTVIFHEKGGLEALRYGEKWRSLTGDGMVLAMLQEVDELRAVVAEVHAWAVCAAITTPADMAQNFPRIVEITAPQEAQ